MFKVWNPDDGNEDDCAESYHPSAFSGQPRWAAEAFARNRDWECGEGHAEAQTVFVRCPNGDLKKYIVKTRQHVFYYAEDEK